MTPLELLEPVVRDVIAPAAVDNDTHARYPRSALEALGRAGLLGLISAKSVGGMGCGLREAAEVIERIGQECPSTAMVVTMHYSAVDVIERYGSESIRREIAAGRHVSTLAVSETGSRSHIWAPVGTATPQGDNVMLDAHKSMTTSAGEANSYVWSSRAAAVEGNTLWLVPSRTPGLTVPARYDGLGLRGNASSPIIARGVLIPAANRLGADGAAEHIMHAELLPVFVTLIASTSVGLMEGILRRTVAHVAATRFADVGSTLADLPTIRAYIARAKIRADQAKTLRDDTIVALAARRADAPLRMMEVKVSAAEAALEVTDVAMRVCGGAAFRKDVGIERLFRDSRAASIMAPTSDVLFDMIGAALTDAAKAAQ